MKITIKSAANSTGRLLRPASPGLARRRSPTPALRKKRSATTRRRQGEGPTALPASHWSGVTERQESSPSGPWVVEAGCCPLRSLAGKSCQSSCVRRRARRCTARPVEQSRSLLQREDGGRGENFAGAARKGQREPQECGREYPQAHRPGPKRCEVRVERNVRGRRGTPRVGENRDGRAADRLWASRGHEAFFPGSGRACFSAKWRRRHPCALGALSSSADRGRASLAARHGFRTRGKAEPTASRPWRCRPGTAVQSPFPPRRPPARAKPKTLGEHE